MRRFTTPSFEVSIDADLTGCDVYITIRQGRRRLDIIKFDSVTVDGDVTTLTFTLTQAQSAMFSEKSDVEVQANVKDQAGYRDATDTASFRFGRNILERRV